MESAAYWLRKRRGIFCTITHAMATVMPLSMRFSISDEEITEARMSFMATTSVAVSTDVPLTPVAPPYTNAVISDAEIALTSVHTSQMTTTPHFLRNSPALTI